MDEDLQKTEDMIREVDSEINAMRMKLRTLTFGEARALKGDIDALKTQKDMCQQHQMEIVRPKRQKIIDHLVEIQKKQEEERKKEMLRLVEI